MKVPSIHVRLSDVLGRHYPHNSSQNVSSWAVDIVEINLKNIESWLPQSSGSIAEPELRGKDEQTVLLASEQHRFNIVIDARVKVADPSRFGPLKGNVEHDVAFNERLGVFAFIIEAKVGSSILDTLAHRLQALSRLAGSIDAIRQSRRDVQCEEITLNKVTFSYTDQARSAGDEPHQNVPRWTASLDLRTDNMKLMLGPGNPQVRATGQFNKLINSKEGFHGVPWFLSITLPIQRALDAVEDAWGALTMNDQGRVDICVISLDWYTVKYNLGPAKNVGRRLTTHLKLQSRNDKAEWHIYREETGPVKQPDDEFQKVLENLWKSDDRVWRNLSDGVAAAVNDEVESLVKAIDEAIRPLAIKSPSVSRQPQPKAATSRAVSQNKSTAANRVRPQHTGPVVISLDD
jgi:mediator of RNA polymerase II transcription subunit 14